MSSSTSQPPAMEVPATSDLKRLCQNKKKCPYPELGWFSIITALGKQISFSGMQSILVLYFRYVFLFSENAATQAFHIFATACHFTPVFSAILVTNPSLLNQFWPTVGISGVYSTGIIVLALSAVDGTSWMTYLGLALIALGTGTGGGGVKPCVSPAFDGDQFQSTSKGKKLTQFFSLLYLAIILSGILLATFLTPVLRQNVHCFGRDDCFPLAFALPVVPLLLAVLFFLIASALKYFSVRGNYHVNSPPKTNNILLTTLQCVCYALWKKLFSGSSVEKKNHWLEYADCKFDRQTINDVRALMPALFPFLPMPLFWALFGQMASRWTLQATHMNTQIEIFGLFAFTIKADQIGVINALLVILIVPLFKYAIFPLMTKMRLCLRPLQKMTIGGLLAALSFLLCALVQQHLELEQPAALLPGHHHVALLNGMCCPDVGCGIGITSPLYNGTINKQTLLLKNVPADQLADFPVIFNDTCYYAPTLLNSSKATFPRLHEDTTLLFKFDYESLDHVGKSLSVNSNLVVLYPENIIRKPLEGGKARLYTLFSLFEYFPFSEEQKIFTISGHSSELNVHIISNYSSIYWRNNYPDTFRIWETVGYLDPFEIEVGSKENDNQIVMGIGEKHRGVLKGLEQGATYVQLIYGHLKKEVNFTEVLTKIVEANQLSVFWQVPQYLAMASAEVMLSSVGLEFAYAQTPASMRPVLQAAWLLTVATGNVIIAVTANLNIFHPQSQECIFYASAMAIVTAIFAVMAYFYVPSRYSGEPEGDGAAIVINATSSSDLQSGEGVNGDGGNSHSGNNMPMEPIISEQQIISRFTVVPVKEPISIAY